MKRKSITQRIRRLLKAAFRSGFSPYGLWGTRFRQWRQSAVVKPPGKQRLRQKIIQKEYMETRLLPVQWLNSLLLSAGLFARLLPLRRTRFRRSFLLIFLSETKHLKENIFTHKIKKRTMDIEIRLLRWIGLLELSDRLWQQENLAHFSWFRRP